jgi:hypothetical protein
MSRIFASLAFAFVSLSGLVAKAAPVDIYVTETVTSGSGGVLRYSISVAPSPDLGNISIWVVGASGRTLAPLPQISVLDSPFVGGPLGATLQITSVLGQNLVPQTGDPLERTVLATITPSSFDSFVLHSGDDTFGFTAVNRALTEPVHYRLWFYEDPHGGPGSYDYQLVDSWLPEPTTTALVALAFAALALARYCSVARSIL